MSAQVLVSKTQNRHFGAKVPFLPDRLTYMFPSSFLALVHPGYSSALSFPFILLFVKKQTNKQTSTRTHCFPMMFCWLFNLVSCFQEFGFSARPKAGKSRPFFPTCQCVTGNRCRGEIWGLGEHSLCLGLRAPTGRTLSGFIVALARLELFFSRKNSGR